MHPVTVFILICKIGKQIAYIGRRRCLCQRKYSRQQEQNQDKEGKMFSHKMTAFQVLHKSRTYHSGKNKEKV
jgi:hypothetical protein